MSVLNINDRYVDSRGKEFVVMQEQDDIVWYAHEDTMYCCSKAAFLERFTRIDNQA